MRHDCDDPFANALDTSEYDLRDYATRAEDLLRKVISIEEVRKHLDPDDYREGMLLMACEVVHALYGYDLRLPIPVFIDEGTTVHYRGFDPLNGR